MRSGKIGGGAGVKKEGVTGGIKNNWAKKCFGKGEGVNNVRDAAC